MRGYNYTVGDRVYRIAPIFIPKGTKGTVCSCRIGDLVEIQFDNGRIWYCNIKLIKPLVRVVG